MIVSGAFAAAFAVGAAGFGDGLVATAFWLPVLAPVDAVPLVVSLGVTIQVIVMWRLRGGMDLAHVMPFLVGGTLGVPVGAWLLAYADPVLFRFAMGLFLVAYAGLFLSLRRLPTVTAGGWALDGSVGGIGGLLGGLAGLSGFIPALWCALRGWTPAQQRGVMQPYLLGMHGMALAWLAMGGMVTADTGLRYLWTLPGIAAGCWLGLSLYGRLDAAKFRRAVLAMLLAAGGLLLAQTGGQVI